ncbi:DoxX family protein [uncultured Lacinutrix sp.]|uniref:DoxX family protein n=1 Tax=uncultured Lacinutrix sp. TaxID=574032 RepID=UPI00262BDB5D|nr:DoxX family protein [uncultured Lacinutrix sp.]
MKTNKIIYWTATTLLALLFFAGAMMYLFNYPRAEGFFISLGFPTWIIYPLAFLKIAGAITILTKWSKFLKELAYAGFLFDAILALVAHAMVSDGEYLFATVALIFISVSWVFDRKVYGNYQQNKIIDDNNK